MVYYINILIRHTNIRVSHVTSTTNGRGTRIRYGIDVTSDSYQILHHGQFAGYDSRPKGCHMVEAIILRHFIVSTLLNVRLANGYEILCNYYCAAFAGNEKWRTAIALLSNHFTSGLTWMPAIK